MAKKQYQSIYLEIYEFGKMDAVLSSSIKDDGFAREDIYDDDWF